MANTDVLNSLWRLGVQIVHASKRAGIPGLEHALGELARRYIPPPRDRNVQIAPGIKLTMPPGFRPARTYAMGLYEQEVTKTIRSIANPGMGVVDVGAFCGYYTVLASQLVGPAGCVYAFEPHPGNFAHLVHNISTNGCQNVVLANVAVSAESGSGKLILEDDADHHWLSTRSDGAGFSVPTVSLDGFFSLRDWPPIHLIKIDAEGIEVSVLRGMRELSHRNPGAVIIVEFDEQNLARAGTTGEELAALLRDLGFTRGHILERGMKAFSLQDALPSMHRITYNLLFTRESPVLVGAR